MWQWGWNETTRDYGVCYCGPAQAPFGSVSLPQPSLPSVQVEVGSLGWVLAVACSRRGKRVPPSYTEGPISPS